MKFGYYANRGSLTYSKIKESTLKAEKLGFDSVHIHDHFMMQDGAFLEAGMLAAALAVQTQKIKVGHLVLCNSFRNPALLAKMISTLDNISNGRALMWLGAGWYKREYLGYGYPFPSPKVRVDQLEESLTIFKKAFTEDVFSFEGQFWKLKRMKNIPRPIQKPYPQIVLGSNGKRMTDIACREADGINMPSLKVTQIPKRVAYILDKLKKYNRNPDDFEISVWNDITLVKNQEEIELRRPDQLEKEFIGFPEDIKERIAEIEDAGVKKMVIYFGESQIEDQMTEFSKKVM